MPIEVFNQFKAEYDELYERLEKKENLEMEIKQDRKKEMKYKKERIREVLYYDTYKGYNFYVLNLGTHPTAYVEIPKGHELYEKDYGEININVHGGLTYSDHFLWGDNGLLGVEKNSWFIGWDYAHYNDYDGYFGERENDLQNLMGDLKKWSTDEIIYDCIDVINQIIELESRTIN